jgi:hypothetical protein
MLQAPIHHGSVENLGIEPRRDVIGPRVVEVS